MTKKQAVKDKNAFFRALLIECEKKGTYSVIEKVEEAGIAYREVQAWATSNPIWSNILEICRDCCAYNAEMDGLYTRIPSKLVMKYMCENDDEFKAHYDKQQSLMVLKKNHKKRLDL